MIRVTEIALSWFPVTDMARGREFYEGVLGLKATQAVGEPGGMQWTEYDIALGTLSIGAGVPDWKPRAEGCSVGLEVEDFDAAIAHQKANGVKLKMEPYPRPSAAWRSFSIRMATRFASTNATRSDGLKTSVSSLDWPHD